MDREGEGTKFTIDRKIFSSDIWFASPWKLKIWIYLLGNANHKDGNFMGVEIKRGQILRSYRTIAKDCGYKIGYRLKKPSIDTVRRICEELTKDLRTRSRTVHCGTLFTIINYNELQPLSKTRSVQAIVQQSYNDRTMGVHNKNVKNDNNVKNEKIPPYIPPTGRDLKSNGHDWIDPESWDCFLEHRDSIKKPLSKRAVQIALNLLKNNMGDQKQIIDNSILNNWTGLFEIKNKKSDGGWDELRKEFCKDDTI